MFAPKYTFTQYKEAFIAGAKKYPFYPPVGKWRPGWLAKIRLTPYYYTEDDLWMAYAEGFRNHPLPREKTR